MHFGHPGYPNYGDADAALQQIPFLGPLFAPPAGSLTGQQVVQDVSQLQAQTSSVSQYMPLILIGGGVLLVALLIKR